MKYLFLSILVFALCVCSYAGAESAFRDIPMEEVHAAFNQPIQPHPRLFITDRQVTQIQAKLESQPPLQAFFRAMLTKADDILDQPPVKRVKTGRRLLSVSRRWQSPITCGGKGQTFPRWNEEHLLYRHREYRDTQIALQNRQTGRRLPGSSPGKLD